MEHIQSIYRRNLYILITLWGFVFGILLSSFVHVHPLVSVLLIFIALAIYVVERIVREELHIFVLIGVLSVTSFALGTLRFAIKDFHELVEPSTTGLVVSEPERRDADTRFVFEADNSERILVTTDLLSEVEYGDRVGLLGIPKTIKEGSYANYLSKDDIYYTLDRAKISILESGSGNPVLGKLFKVKEVFVEEAREVLPEPEASLLSGLIVSGKQALPKDILEDFRRAGVVHIVVLSGYNIAVIAEFLLIVFAFLGSRRASAIALCGVIFFTLISGLSATVLRGAIMVSILLLGKLYKRKASSGRVLLFTGVLMLIYNPKYLVFDASFDLSFLALLGLVYGTPIIQRFADRILPAHGHEGNSRSVFYRLTELMSATLATQIFVLPFLLYNMGNFSLVFLLSNLLILPVLPIVMFVGLLGVILAFLSNILAWPIVFVAHILLAWILKVSEVLGGMPLAQVEIENFPLWGSLLMYLCISFILWRSRNSLRSSPSLD